MKKNSVFVSLLLGAVALSCTACRSTLYNAAAAGNLQAVKQELAQGADPNGRASNANLLWQIPTCVITFPIDMARSLAFTTLIWPMFDPLYYFDSNGDWQYNEDKYFTQEVFNFTSKTAADVATSMKRYDILTEVIIAGGQSSEWARAKVVSEAARRGDTETLKKLLQKGIDPNWNCSGDYNPLMLAIGEGHEGCARLLLEHGARFESKVKIQNKTISVYQRAVSMGQRDLYKKLGGPIVTSPVSLNGKIITMHYDNAQVIHKTDPNAPWEKGSCENMHPISFRITHKPGRNYKGQHRVYTYQKTGENTAIIECYYSEAYEKHILTFTSPTRATATCDSDCGGDYSIMRYSNIIFTFDY